MAPIKMMQ